MIRHATAAILLFTLGCMYLATQAAASELPFPSAQLRDDYGEELPYAIPPAVPAGLCLIDSGVNLNPDTAPVTVYREALDGGTPDDVDPMQHGTRMAMEAAAVPNNNWGTVGAAPGAIRIVSIRVMESDGTVSFTGYKQAILRCRDLAAVYNIKVISLSLGYPTTPSEAELQEA
jgi:subtilisin family serine protease